MATSRKTDMLCPECGSEDTGNTLHKNTYEFECGTHWIPVEFHAGPHEYRSVSVACRTIKAMRTLVNEVLSMEVCPICAGEDPKCHLCERIDAYKIDIANIHQEEEYA